MDFRHACRTPAGHNLHGVPTSGGTDQTITQSVLVASAPSQAARALVVSLCAYAVVEHPTISTKQ